MFLALSAAEIVGITVGVVLVVIVMMVVIGIVTWKTSSSKDGPYHEVSMKREVSIQSETFCKSRLVKYNR